MKRLMGIGAAVLLAGCSAASNPALERAQTDFARIHQDPEISGNAPVAVHEAAQALQRAEHAWHEDRDKAEVDHLAYLAQQRVAIARNVAEEASARETAVRLAEERDKILLQSSRREAEEARRRAEAAAARAQQARQLANSRALEAERARLGQETQAREALLARQQAEKQAQEAEAARQQAEARSQELERVQSELQARVREAQEQQQKAEASAQKVKQLEQQLAEFKARETERGLQLTLSGVLFEFDKANLKPGALRDLQPLVDFLKSNPDRQVTLEGHTDSVGNDQYNRQLSQERADAVKRYLVQHGVDQQRISAQGFGEEYPVASNNTQAGRLQNRRVEIIISEEPARTAGTRNATSTD